VGVPVAWTSVRLGCGGGGDLVRATPVGVRFDPVLVVVCRCWACVVAVAVTRRSLR